MLTWSSPRGAAISRWYSELRMASWASASPSITTSDRAQSRSHAAADAAKRLSKYSPASAARRSIEVRSVSAASREDEITTTFSTTAVWPGVASQRATVVGRLESSSPRISASTPRASSRVARVTEIPDCVARTVIDAIEPSTRWLAQSRWVTPSRLPLASSGARTSTTPVKSTDVIEQRSAPMSGAASEAKRSKARRWVTPRGLRHVTSRRSRPVRRSSARR